MIFGIVLAGGVGSRMNTTANMPKQFLPLGDKPIVMQTLDKFVTCDRFDAVYIGTHPDWVDHMAELIETHIASDVPITVVAGGSDRNATLFNVIAKIEEDHGEDENHIIVTHDAVRPFVTLRMINENIDAAKEYGARGGTVIHARGTANSLAEKKFEIPVQPDKEMVMILVPTSIKDDVLHGLYRAVGLKTPGQGIAFSLPVDAAVGLMGSEESAEQKA